MIKVIFTNGKLGDVSYTRLAKSLQLHRIAAYKLFDVWIEVRRGHKSDYQGPERRVCNLY